MAACDGENLSPSRWRPIRCTAPRFSSSQFLLNASKLRVFGPGTNLVSVCYVDNYCHGLIIGERALYPGSPALRNFYICTDGEPVNPGDPSTALTDIRLRLAFSKFKLPGWSFMYPLGRVRGRGVPYREAQAQHPAVRMLLINRYFDPSESKRDLGYEPIVTPDDARGANQGVVQERGCPSTDRARRRSERTRGQCGRERAGESRMDAGRRALRRACLA